MRTVRRGSAICLAAAWAALGASSLLGCEDPWIGRCGTYTDTTGTARIVSVETAPAGEYNCRNDPVRVLFDFTPADPARAAMAASGVQWTIGGGANPPRAWVLASGLTVGSDHPAVRRDQPVGPCSPVVWHLVDVDEAAGVAACW